MAFQGCSATPNDINSHIRVKLDIEQSKIILSDEIKRGGEIWERVKGIRNKGSEMSFDKRKIVIYSQAQMESKRRYVRFTAARHTPAAQSQN